jgi:hypothetical protein
MTNKISMVSCATDTETRDVDTKGVLDAIRTGGKTLRGQITQIRNRFEAELAITGAIAKQPSVLLGLSSSNLPASCGPGRFHSVLQRSS